jgi:hypothetical protein
MEASAPSFFLTDPQAEKPPLVYSPPPFTQRSGRLYRLVGYVTRRGRIFIRWDLMEVSGAGA